MIYLLDTDTCIYIMKKHPAIVDKLDFIEADEVAVSSISVSELYYGVEKSQKKKSNKKFLDNFLSPISIITYNHSAAKAYGLIRAKLETSGQIIGPLDMLIAAHALSQNLILVTNNVKEFNRIENLKIENWMSTH